MKRKQIRQFYYLDIIITGSIITLKEILSDENKLGHDILEANFKRNLTNYGKIIEKTTIYLAKQNPNIKIKKAIEKYVTPEAEMIMREIFRSNHLIKKSESNKSIQQSSVEDLPYYLRDFIFQAMYIPRLFIYINKKSMDKNELKLFGEMEKRIETLFEYFKKNDIIW